MYLETLQRKINLGRKKQRWLVPLIILALLVHSCSKLVIAIFPIAHEGHNNTSDFLHVSVKLGFKYNTVKVQTN